MDEIIKLMGETLCARLNPGGMQWSMLPKPFREKWSNDLRAALSAIHAGGWRIVPVESDTKMQNAAIDTYPFQLGDISPLGFRMSPQQLFAECYRAMLASSPIKMEE